MGESNFQIEEKGSKKESILPNNVEEFIELAVQGGFDSSFPSGQLLLDLPCKTQPIHSR